MTHDTAEMAKALVALGSSATLWASNKAMALTESVPDILREFGLPIVVAGLSVWGGVKIFALYKITTDARIADRDALLHQRDTEVKEAADLRQAMLKTLQQMAEAIEEQTRLMRDRLPKR